MYFTICTPHHQYMPYENFIEIGSVVQEKKNMFNERRTTNEDEQKPIAIVTRVTQVTLKLKNATIFIYM